MCRTVQLVTSDRFLNVKHCTVAAYKVGMLLIAYYLIIQLCVWKMIYSSATALHFRLQLDAWAAYQDKSSLPILTTEVGCFIANSFPTLLAMHEGAEKKPAQIPSEKLGIESNDSGMQRCCSPTSVESEAQYQLYMYQVSHSYLCCNKPFRQQSVTKALCNFSAHSFGHRNCLMLNLHAFWPPLA